MGDGGVTLAPSQHVMERFPISETHCGGNGTVFSSKPFNSDKKMRKGEVVVGSEKGRNFEERTRGKELERRRKGNSEKREWQNGELEKGEFVSGRNGVEMELGEFIPDKPRWNKGEVEKGEFVPDSRRKKGGSGGDGEKSEFFGSGRGRKIEVEKGEFVLEKSRKGDSEKGDFGSERWGKWEVEKKDGEGEKSDYNWSGRGRRMELEKGEFVPENNYGSKGEVEKKSLEGERSESVRGRKMELEKGEFVPDSNHRRKEGGRSEIDHRKKSSSSSKWDGIAHERDSKKSSRASEEEPGQFKHESYNGKSRDKDFYSENWPKRHCMESESSGRKSHQEFTDNSRSKSWRKSEESNPPSRSNYSERLYGNPPSLSSSIRHSSSSSSRHQELYLPSRGSHDRQGHRDHRDRDRTPSHSDRSPLERARHRDQRERSPHDRGRAVEHRERGKKSGGGEKQQISKYEDRQGRRESSGKESFKNNSVKQVGNSSTSYLERCSDDKTSKKKVSSNSDKESSEPPLLPLPPPPPPPPGLPPPVPPPEPESNGDIEEPPSMEEDMDICDTPPHVSVTADSKPGKWFYLDHFGTEQGPSRLPDLKRYVEEGVLLSDHLIKHADSDRWVTVENAASPLVQVDLPSIVSDAVTELASPPEAPGNSLIDSVDLGMDVSASPPQQELDTKSESVELEAVEDLHIDERVEALLDGYRIIDGKEIETVGEALNMTFEHVEWENWCHSEGFTRFQARSYDLSGHPREETFNRGHEGFSRETTEIRHGGAPFEKEDLIVSSSSTDWFSGRWSCKGGDWKRNEEASQDRSSKKKIVLNHGYPLCQMPKSGHEDPRWYRRDDLYYAARIRKLELPPWAFSLSEDNIDATNMISRQVKPPVPRGVKGTVLPVVRINACVVRDHGSSEPHVRTKGSERHAGRSSRSHAASSDRSSVSEGSSHSKKPLELDLESLHKCRTVLNIPKDHVCTVDELSVDLGDWYYLDGAGHEHGPSSYAELQDLAGKGTILQDSSVFRKFDNVWLPICAPESTHSDKERMDSTGSASNTADEKSSFDTFHGSHPQFIGYTRGKLHELVMKSYKTREFAAAINEVLDPWISAKQPKKEMDKHFPFNSSITKSSAFLTPDLSGDKLWKSDDAGPDMYRDYSRPGKRARLLFDESEDSEIEEDLLVAQKNDSSFDDLCGEAAFEDIGTNSEQENESWGLLNGHVLARIFHFMKTDMKSLVSSAATCKRWNLAVKFYKGLCRHVDLSSAGPDCTDSMFRSIMGGYEKKILTSIILMGCSNISACVVEEVLRLFPCISSIDIRGCSQFKDLISKFHNVKWIKSSSRSAKNHEESCSKIRSLKQITEKSHSTSKGFKGLGGHLDDFSDSGDFGNNEFDLVDRRESSSHPFRQGVYKRAKLLDARKSSAVLSRDARMRRWLHRKSENGYRKMEEFIAVNLKGIMKENTFEFFIPKVAEIEERMRNGYYVRHGLGSVKDDISRMCRDAFKAKNRGDAKDMKHIIMLFIRLAKSLEGNPRITNEREELIKALKDDPEIGFYSSTSKYKKKQNKMLSEKKGMNRISNTSYGNGGTDPFDREIKRSLSKLKKKDMDSNSETSDDHENDFSEENDRGEGETTASDTESDLDLRSGGGIGDAKGSGYFMVDDTLDSVTDDREWGARMTKASLVPPVTRKYEVIDRYLVIADEEEVKRKMRVALPDDYSEKLLAQKSGLEESDMEIPEVKEYKPRKMLGVEVLEQEVYGIDPYTHNLLLDSMPEEPEWLLVDKHKFIEEVLLPSLNKQVRHFTGAGNTPMVYRLRPVVEEIQKDAEENGDKRMVKLCQTILRAMQSRPDDNYVAYRKGLGVVCNKAGGFGEDDFVVEFLGEVYPAWKWFEKQDGIRSLQKNNQDPAPEFYNIYLERPKGDRDGYDLVVVDAMHKANYASRICHSCRPNCEAKVTAVDGQYQIGIYAVRPIGYGEEITFDYNSVTESKEEYEASVCLCGSQICRGSYLNLTGEGAFQKVLKECHGVLDRHKLILEACEANTVSQEDYIDLGRAGLGTCLLAGLPDWLVAYSAHLVRFINFERTRLPMAILKHNLEEKKKFFADICLEDEKSDAEVQAEGVYNSRLQNMALTLDKVRYVMRRVFGDPKKAPPPLQKLSPEGSVSALWKGEGSLVEELLQSMAPHMEADLLSGLKSKIRAHDPSGADNLPRELRKSLLWLRDELRNLPCSAKCRHDAAADLIHIYAYTKCFYKAWEYKSVKSPPVYISPLDLGPKYVDKMGSGFQEYCKTYGENYCLGQLIYWHSQANADPDCRLARARRGCLSLPDISSFYGKSHKPVHERVYDSRTLRFMLSRMEKQPQRPWPKDRIWVFRSNPRFFGSPMLDAVLNNCPLDKEMLQWLRSRPSMYQCIWDG